MYLKGVIGKASMGASLSPRQAAGRSPSWAWCVSSPSREQADSVFPLQRSELRRRLAAEGGARPESSWLLAWTQPPWCSASHVEVEGRAQARGPPWGLRPPGGRGPDGLVLQERRLYFILMQTAWGRGPVLSADMHAALETP